MNIRKILYLVLAISLITARSSAQASPEKKLVILHTNDLHSRLNGFSPEAEYTPLSINDDNTLGGFARLATMLEEERKISGNHLLVLDDGDFLMGTFFHMLEESTGFQLSLMRKMGYDLVTLGNHEFDFGPQVLAEIISKSAGSGSSPLIIASNLTFSEKDDQDDALKILFDQKIIRPYLVLEKDGLKIGIIGILGVNAIHDSPRAKPVQFEDPVKAAKKYARLLKQTEKVDLVICMSHSGVTRDDKGSWSGEDVKLAQKVPEIDVIISGHTHTLLDKPINVNGIPIVQTGAYGAGLGRLELVISQQKIVRTDYKVLPITDSIPGDPAIQNLIRQQEKLVSEKILGNLRLTYSSVVTETSFPLVCDPDTLLEKSNLGPLIADAIYSGVNRILQSGTDISLFPAGMARDNIKPGRSGQQTISDLFRVVSLGNGMDNIPGYPLARTFVTGKELKGIMEVLYLAPSSSPDNYIYFSGLRATYDPEKGLLRKITSIEIGDPVNGYVPLDWSKENTSLYSITANTYLLEFVGLIKKLSKGLVKVTLKNEKGAPIKSIQEAVIDADPLIPGIQELKEWVVLLDFLQQQPDTDNNGIPEIPAIYRTGSPRLYRE
jgi:5'-nucleotidase / UDP-sugar diphosphatase